MLIAITPEEPVNCESRKIDALLMAGWHRVHLRHPQLSRQEMHDILNQIAPEFHSRIVLHSHFDLAYEFNIGGLHLNHRHPTPPDGYTGRISRSCHSIDEINRCGDMAYVTLSPIFDSISKTGYASAFSADALKAIDGCGTDVIALGGVTPEQTKHLKKYNFKGYAMLGAIPWSGSIVEVHDFASQALTSITDTN